MIQKRQRSFRPAGSLRSIDIYPNTAVLQDRHAPLLRCQTRCRTGRSEGTWRDMYSTRGKWIRLRYSKFQGQDPADNYFAICLSGHIVGPVITAAGETCRK